MVSKIFKQLLGAVGAVSVVIGGLQVIGLSWSELSQLGHQIGLTAIIDKPIATLILLLGLGLLWIYFATRNRALYVRECSMIIVFDAKDPTKAHMEIDQTLQAYADNVTAMFSQFTPDERGEIPKRGIKMSLVSDENGRAFEQQRIILEGTAKKGWTLRHEFGSALSPCYGNRWWRRVRRTGRVEYINSLFLESDFHQFSTERYQVGSLKLGIAVPLALNDGLTASGELLINHGVIKLPVYTDFRERPDYAVHYIKCKPQKDLAAKYRLSWQKQQGGG